MVTRALPLVLLAACCCTTIQQPLNEVGGTPYGAREATLTARDIWAHELHHALPDPPVIVWYVGECLRYEGEDYSGGLCTIGKTWVVDGGFAGLDTDAEIHVLTAHPRAIAHEVLHWALWIAIDDVDPDHSHPLWGRVHDVVQAIEPDLRLDG